MTNQITVLMKRRGVTEISNDELILVRHGATIRPRHLCGRTDVALAQMPSLPEQSALAGLTNIWVSPAKRARQTAAGLWPGRETRDDARLWEQDFGDWDGMAYADIPDMGKMDRAALADFAAPGGESFNDVVARVEPALRELSSNVPASGPVAIVAHAGVVRAALAVAMGDASGALAFEVDHLSVTRLRCLENGGFSVISVNQGLA